MNRCERCGNEAVAWTESYFNTQVICMECYDAEAAHPQFEVARAADDAALLRGDRSFRGIGLPDELVTPYMRKQQERVASW